MNLPYPNVRQAADDLKRQHFPGLKVLSYNWRDPYESNLVWLTGTKERQAVKYAKFKLTTDNAYVSADEILCGINIEKGLLDASGSTKRLDLLDETWFWHRFLEVSNNPFAERIAEASREFGQDLKLAVSVAMLTEQQNSAHVLFDVRGGSLAIDQSGGSTSVLQDLPSVETIAKFSDELKNLNQGNTLNWYWMDILVGQVFTRDPSGANDLDRCAAMLKPFQDWLMTAGE